MTARASAGRPPPSPPGPASEPRQPLLAAAPLESADAALRRAPRVEARHHLARAAALRALGFGAAADADLRRAFRIGSSDPAIIEAALGPHGDPQLRAAAARAALVDDRASDAGSARAIATLLAEGCDPLLGARRDGPALSGWVASRHTPAPRLWAVAADGARLAVNLEEVDGHEPSRCRWSWRALDHADHGSIRAIRAVSAAGAAATLSVPGPEIPQFPRRRPATGAHTGREPGVTVVVPVYGDPGSLSACLASLELQGGPDLSVIVVDDASPDREVSRLAASFCRARRRLYLRNPANRGFAASVNAALARSRGTDVLLLNSDVVLPEGAIARLRRAAHRAFDIGIVSPLSNDAGNASFPDPLAPEAALPAADALRVDRAARRVNDGLAVDLPSVHASCLYVRRDCLERTGPLSSAYGRGYYEDVDLCLRAREVGFRVVAACDVYVSHHSGRSFGSDRAPLVVRNAGVLDRRFPGHRAEDAAHDRADPLRGARAALEEAEPLLDGPVVLLVGRKASRGALLDERAREARREGGDALVLEWWPGQGGWSCRLGAEAARGPRSLAFPLEEAGLDRLRRYLSRLSLVRVELVEAAALPARLDAWLSTSDLAPLHVVVDGVPAARALAARAAASDRRSPSSRPPDAVLATDPMARACAAALIGSDPPLVRARPRPAPTGAGRPARAVPAGAGVLGVVLPQPCPDAERLLLALARRLRRAPVGRLLVFGAPASAARIEAPGTCWVSGAIALAEVAEALDHHAVGRLLLPYRDACRWALDAVGRGGRPAAWFDWAPPVPTAAEGDLALPPGEDDATACSRILAWLARGPGPDRA